jgi:undecaprenyl pyrophosphate synthase
VGSVFRVKRFTAESRNYHKDVRKLQIIPDQVWKWLRQQSKDFYTAGVDSLVKLWDKCINVGGGYVEKYIFYPRSNIMCFTFYIHL